MTYSGPNCGRRGKFCPNYLSFRETPPKKKLNLNFLWTRKYLHPSSMPKTGEKNSENRIASLNEVDVQTAWK